ncbi:uncharacterized protein HaLaN_12053, partial [Haematococcus lacustris]
MMEGEKGCAAAGAQEGSEQEVSGPAFTCRYTAALRHVETQCVPNPVLVDHLAPHLCGPKGLQLAQKELQQLVAAQSASSHPAAGRPAAASHTAAHPGGTGMMSAKRVRFLHGCCSGGQPRLRHGHPALAPHLTALLCGLGPRQLPQTTLGAPRPSLSSVAPTACQ